MRFLVQRDYERNISVTDLNTVFDNSTDVNYTVLQRLIDCEQNAIEEITSLITQRYDVGLIFTDSSAYSSGNTYYANSRVQYHEPAFNAATIYTIGQRVSQAGSIFSSIAGSAAHAFNASEWVFVCSDLQLFYGIMPATSQVYVQINTYNVGDVVWNPYDNRTYTSKINSNNQSLNVVSAWTQNAIYSFTAILPTNGTYWVQGDNRNAKLVSVMVDIVIYHGLKTITQRFKPEDRLFNYLGDGRRPDVSARGWLDAITKGGQNATLPPLPIASTELSLRWYNMFGDSETLNSPSSSNMTY
jgi:hypothetical protein